MLGFSEEIAVSYPEYVAKFEPVDSMELAAHLVRECAKQDCSLNITKLTKLMYCCYGSVLGKYGRQLTDEYPECRQYGPVFPEVLKSLQFFGLEPFRKAPAPTVEALPAPVLLLVNKTAALFGRHSSDELMRWTMLRGSPWYRASDGGAVLYGRLSDEAVAAYFRQEVLA